MFCSAHGISAASTVDSPFSAVQMVFRPLPQLIPPFSAAGVAVGEFGNMLVIMMNALVAASAAAAVSAAVAAAAAVAAVLLLLLPLQPPLPLLLPPLLPPTPPLPPAPPQPPPLLPLCVEVAMVPLSCVMFGTLYLAAYVYPVL